ncbi:MAG: ABC transporter substrate-binding protein [Aestuariibacter sp.]
MDKFVMPRKLTQVIFSIVVILACSDSHADDVLSVLYPEVPSPYDQIFSEIIAGIESEYAGDVSSLSLEKSDSVSESVSWVQQQNTKMLIALGGRGYKVAKQISVDTPTVIGALPIRPNGLSGVSLLADPEVLFTTLKQLAPKIKRVHVVYSPENRWLIELATVQAGLLGLELNNIEVKSIKNAAVSYESLLNDINPATDAVWLPLDRYTAHEQAILPNLLEKSWEQNLVLFSSKPEHAKRGALFSLFPDHYALGKQLVKMVTAMHADRRVKGVIPLKEMKLAVNLRTAAHLGLDYESQKKETFHLTFPQ